MTAARDRIIALRHLKNKMKFTSHIFVICIIFFHINSIKLAMDRDINVGSGNSSPYGLVYKVDGFLAE